MYKIYILHWDSEKAHHYANQLTDAGYQTNNGPLDNKSMRKLRDDPPDIMIIDLSRQPSSGRDIGIGFRSYKNTRHIPLVFIDGEPAKVHNVHSILPDAIYTDWDNVQPALKQAIEVPLVDPVVPGSVMAAYSGSPLFKKLGIKEESIITLINAPENFEKVLAPLPNGVKVQTKDTQTGDVTICFIHSADELTANINQWGNKYGSKKLWIAWPKKASKLKTDVTQTLVRNTGLANGLVDYKICSINQTWSGLLFTKRKK